MTSNHFYIDTDGLPTWRSSCWQVMLDGEEVRVLELEVDNPIEPPVVRETVRSIVADIIAGSQQYDAGLTALVLAADEYRRREHCRS